MTDPRPQPFECWLCYDTGEVQDWSQVIGTGGLCDCAAGLALAAERARVERERGAGDA